MCGAGGMVVGVVRGGWSPNSLGSLLLTESRQHCSMICGGGSGGDYGSGCSGGEDGSDSGAKVAVASALAMWCGVT